MNVDVRLQHYARLVATQRDENEKLKNALTESIAGLGRTEPRPITLELLDEFINWTQQAPMFLSSPEGRAFGEEMREVIKMAILVLKLMQQQEEETEE